MPKAERKPEPKYKVTQLMTEGQIQGIGGNLWVAKRGKFILAFMIVVFIVGLGVSKAADPIRYSYFTAIMAITITGLMLMLRAGQKFYASLDKTKPIDLTEITK